MSGCKTERDCEKQPWCRLTGQCAKRAQTWNKIENQARRADRARNHDVTCPASRHVHMMADALASKRAAYPMFAEEPKHCAGTLYAVIESLWKARAEIARLKTQLREGNGND